MDKYLRKVFELYVFVCAFLFASRPLNDPDFWWHLKTGEYIIRNGVIPRTDLFSFTNYGQPWVAHGWLSGTIFYAIYSQLGFNFLIVVFAVMTAVAFWITYERCRSHPFIAGFATLLGVWALLNLIGVRPRVFTLLLTSIFLALLTRYARYGRGKAIWWLVPLMALWANLHGGFLIGLGLIALTMIGIVFDAWAAGEILSSAWKRFQKLAIVLVGSLLAGLLNPYGVRIYTFPIKVLSSPVFQNLVDDWLSPNFHRPDLFPLLVLVLLTIAALGLSPKRARPSELLLFLAAFYATLRAQRNMAILILVAVPLFADHFQNWLDSTSFGRLFSRKDTSGSPRAAVLVGLLLLLPLVMFAFRLKATVFSQPRQEAIDAPIKAVEYLKENHISGNTFTNPNIWGGYLIWVLPSNPVYIDGRDVYPEQFVKEYLDIITGLADWREPFDRYGVRVVIVKPISPLARELKESSGWQQVFQDDMAVVFTRR